MAAPRAITKLGKPIVDSTEDLVVHVTRDCVRRAKPMDPTQCAVAKALTKEKGVVSARVQLTRTWIEYPTKIVRYITPESAAREIVSFDRRAGFDTGDYRLKAPSQHDRIGQRRKSRLKPDRNHEHTGRTNHRTLMVRGT